MDGLLDREMSAIGLDRRSGAADLALRAVEALQAWLRRHPKPGEAELLEIARALLKAQPDMAPLLRLANEVLLACDAGNRQELNARIRANFEEVLRTGPERIAARFLRALPDDTRRVFVTFSCSSTVLHALSHAWVRISSVICSESRPGLEGRVTAKKLAKEKIKVYFTSDLDLPHCAASDAHLVLGADAIGENWLGKVFIVNKLGSSTLINEAIKVENPVWILADTTKLLPFGLLKARGTRSPDPSEIWAWPPRGVIVHASSYFEIAELPDRVRILTENGWMNPITVKRALKKIPISPRLNESAG